MIKKMNKVTMQMIIKQSQLGEKFISKLGELVKETIEDGVQMKLSEQQTKDVIKTTFVILSRKSTEGGEFND